jgi:hypothetical protein
VPLENDSRLELSDVTVWAMFALFVQVTFPPTWIVSSFGLNAKLTIEMGLVSEGVVLPPLPVGPDIRTTAAITTTITITMMIAVIARFLVSFIKILLNRVLYQSYRLISFDLIVRPLSVILY